MRPPNTVNWYWKQMDKRATLFSRQCTKKTLSMAEGLNKELKQESLYYKIFKDRAKKKFCPWIHCIALEGVYSVISPDATAERPKAVITSCWINQHSAKIY